MSPASDSLEIIALGPIEVSKSGEPLLLRAPIQRSLLAVLLSGSGRPVAVPSLLEAVWGDPPPDAARKALMVHLHRLRRSLGDPTRIVHHAHGYSIRVTSDEFDVLAFDELSAAARRSRADGELARSADQFTAAVRLWRGAPFDGAPQVARIAQEAQRLEASRVLARQELLEVGLDLGRHDSLIGELEALTREHPFRERPIALRMLALYRAGRQAEALQVYRWSRAILREEIGVDPGPALQRVHEAILRRDERLDRLAVASLDGEWVPVERPNLRAAPALAPVPRQLPANVYAFTGREETLSELEAARLGTPEDGVPPATAVVIAGMAGVGKTSVAVHWAHRITSDYPDGQLYVNLHGFSAVPPLRPAEALAGMLRSLGLNRDQIPAEPDEAAARLRTETAGRRMLFLLDNARSAEQVVPLLPGGSESLVIVTSRSRLRDLLAEHGGYLMRLAPLAPTEAERLLRTLLRLPYSSELPGVAELARRCGNLPLALRIAAASLTGEPEPDLAEFTRRLSGGSELATLQIGDSPSAAMRATFDCSYTALPEAVRRVFRLMGVAPVRSFSAEAVAELAGTGLESAVRSVEHLVDVHLVDRGAGGRFSLHDLTRAYADQLLGPSDPERAAALDRLFNWYVETADVASARRYPGYARLGERHPQPRTATEADAETAGRWLMDEGENLIGVARYAAAHGHGSVAWRLADILRSHAWTELSSAECIELGRAALRGALEEGSESGEAVATLTLATAHHRAAEWAEVAVHAERAIDLARRIGWDVGRASAHHLMALTCALIGRPRDSVHHAESALAINRAIGRLRAQSVNLGALAVARGELGDLGEEMRLHAAGLEIADRIASPGLAASHLRDMASTAVDLGRMGAAEEYLDRVVKIDAVTGDGTLKSGTSSAMAALYAALGDHETSLACSEAAVREADKQGDRTRRALGMARSAIALNGLGRHAEAVEAADRALAAAAPNRSEEGIGVLAVRAVARVEIGEFEAARADAAKLLALATDGGHRIAEAMALNALAEAGVRGGGPVSTADRAREALDIFREAGHRSGEAWSLWLLGLGAWNRGDRVAAGRFWRRVEQVYAETGTPIPTRYRMECHRTLDPAPGVSEV